jgi:hypothetical protein
MCRFLNPMAASEIFDKKKVEVTVSTEDYFFKQMSHDLKGKYSPEELEAMMKDPKRYTELDVIRPA